MSLGWNTESSILPGRGKEIKVSSTSMLSLKAQIEKGKSNSEEIVWHRKGSKPRYEESDLKRRNCGISHRAREDVVNNEGKVSEEKLKAKAQVYEDLATRGVSLADNDVVVDFSAKAQPLKSNTLKSNTNDPWAWSTGRPDAKKQGHEDLTELLQTAAANIKDESRKNVDTGTGVPSEWKETPSSQQKNLETQLSQEICRERHDFESRSIQREERKRQLEQRILLLRHKRAKS